VQEMSDILDMTHDMAKDLHEVGAMDDITMRAMDRLCLPKARALGAADVKAIRKKTRMSQAVFAALLNVGSSTVAQWEQGNRSPSGSSARLLDVIDRKGVEAIA
jgi:putative transcriptional regulator